MTEDGGGTDETEARAVGTQVPSDWRPTTGTPKCRSRRRRGSVRLVDCYLCRSCLHLLFRSLPGSTVFQNP